MKRARPIPMIALVGTAIAMLFAVAFGQTSLAPIDDLAPIYPPDDPIVSQMGAVCSPEPVCRELDTPEPPDCPWWCRWFPCDCEDQPAATEECRTDDGTRDGDPLPIRFDIIDGKFTRDAEFAGYELSYRPHPSDEWQPVCDMRCKLRRGKWRCPDRIDASRCVSHPNRVGYYSLRPWYVLTQPRIFGRRVEGVEPWDNDATAFCGAP